MSKTIQNTSINFLSQRRKELSSVQIEDKKYARWAGYVFGVTFFIGLFVIGLNYYYGVQIETVIANQEDVERQLTQQAEVEREYLVLAEKLDIIQTTLTSKTQKREAIEFFTTLFTDPTVSVRQISIQERGILEFLIETENIFSFNTVLETLESQNVRSRFSSLSVSDMVRSAETKYTVKVTVLVE